MVDYNLVEQYFTTFLTFDWGNTTLTFVLGVFVSALTWLAVKAIINLFII